MLDGKYVEDFLGFKLSDREWKIIKDQLLYNSLEWLCSVQQIKNGIRKDITYDAFLDDWEIHMEEGRNKQIWNKDY